MTSLRPFAAARPLLSAAMVLYLHLAKQVPRSRGKGPAETGTRKRGKFDLFAFAVVLYLHALFRGTAQIVPHPALKCQCQSKKIFSAGFAILKMRYFAIFKHLI